MLTFMGWIFEEEMESIFLHAFLETLQSLENSNYNPCYTVMQELGKICQIMYNIIMSV